MRKLKLFFACLLMAVLSIGQMWGVTITPGSTGWTTDGAEQSATVGGVTISTTKGCDSGTGGQIRIYKDQTFTISASSDITSITFTCTASGTTKYGPGCFSSIAGYSYSGTNGAWTGSATSVTFTASTNQVRITTLEVTLASGGKTLTSIAVSGTPTKTSYYVGDEFDPAGLTVTGHYSDNTDAPISSGITWAYDPSQELALNQTSIGVTATVSEISSPKFNVTGLTVTEAPAAVNYEKVTAEPEDWSGEYLLVYEANATTARVWKGVDEANNYAEATIATGVIAAPEGAAVLTIAKVAESNPVVYSIMVGDKYIGQTSDANGIKIQTTAINNSISYNGTDAAVDIVASSAHLRYNSASSSYFRYYKSATYSSQKKIQLYKKVDGSVKPAAGLAYAEADQKKLTKLGEAFTAPTLENPNSLAVSYASNNTDVAEVAANGAVTIKAAGVAVITASFAGNDDYKEGSASYTIGVTTHTGTEADPYNAIDTKNVIDVMGTKPNAYVSGKISSIITTSSNFDAENGYIWFYISDDGATTGQQIEAFKCLGLSSAKFTAVTDVVEGATVIITGTLKKYQSTYELDQDCYLVSYTAPEEPKTPIVSDIDNPITVANAITYIDAPATYDLSQAVWVRGVVTNIGQTNGQTPIPYIDVKDANTENSFRFFNYTINASITEEPQAGDILIATGLLDKYNSTYELNGCEVVSLNRPEVAVTGIELTESTAEVEVGSTVTLHASVLPENASNKGITWSVQSGNDKAEVDANGVVTGTAAGEAVIRAASTADPTKYAECTVTVTAVDPTKHVVTFDATVDKTTEATELSLTKDDLTIAITDGDGRFNNETDYRVYKNAEFTVSCANGNITKIEMTCTAGNDATGFEDAEGLVQATGTWTGNAASVSLMASVKQVRIETITITYKEDNRLDAGLAYAEAAINKVIGDDAFINPLTNTNSVDVTYETSDDQVAEVDNDGTVTIIGEGTATITASFAGDATFKPANVSYTITVSAAPLTDYYEKVTETAGIVEGTYLIVYEDGENSLAFNGGLETLDAESNTIAVTITNDNKIGVTTETAAATFYIDPAAGTVKSASNHYIGVSSWSNGLKQTDTYVHNVLEIDGDGNAQVGIYKADWNTTGGTMRLQYNKGAGQTRFRYFKNGGQQSIALYKLHNEVVKANPELAWSGNVEITIDGEFTAPTIGYAAGLDAEAIASITYESDNTDVATVTDAGVISLAEPRATGTAHITATFPSNSLYKGATAQCTIKVNPAHSIYVSPSLNVNFGSVEQDATVNDKVITVTLTGVPAATATLEGTGASAFSYDPAALTESGDITISASSATVGTFAATLTISDDAGEAASKVVNLSLTVTEPEIIDDLTGTWVLATAVPEVGQKFIVAGTYNSVTKTMGVQNTYNRAAVTSSLDEWNVLTPAEGTKVFTLVDAGDGKFAIQASNGKYLTASGTGTKNYLTEAADYEAANAKWTISVTNGIASVVASSSNRNDMQYNKSGDGLFACYQTEGQTAIQLFVLGTPNYGSYQRNVTNGNYGTICLPQAGVISGATLFEIGDYANDMIYVDEITSGEMAAGVPYIFQATSDQLNVTYTSSAVEETAGHANGLYGFYNLNDENAQKNLDQDAGNYILYQNAYWLVSGREAYIANYRAYIKISEINAQAPAPGRRRVAMAVHGEQVATGMENVQGDNVQCTKVLINGQLFILRGEKMYDAKGQLVK